MHTSHCCNSATLTCHTRYFLYSLQCSRYTMYQVTKHLNREDSSARCPSPPPNLTCRRCPCAACLFCFFSSLFSAFFVFFLFFIFLLSPGEPPPTHENTIGGRIRDDNTIGLGLERTTPSTAYGRLIFQPVLQQYPSACPACFGLHFTAAPLKKRKREIFCVTRKKWRNETFFFLEVQYGPGFLEAAHTPPRHKVVGTWKMAACLRARVSLLPRTTACTHARTHARRLNYFILHSLGEEEETNEPPPLLGKKRREDKARSIPRPLRMHEKKKKKSVNRHHEASA